MKKIPTLFSRDPEDMRHVTTEVNPECQWVLDGEGRATRKYDGTCVMCDEDGRWWARRGVKRDKPAPPYFEVVETDPVTGKTVGWEPVEQSPFAKFHAEALRNGDGLGRKIVTPGTYELCGPKINGNPESYPAHFLIPHADATRIRPFSLTYEGIRDTCLLVLRAEGFEGMVWHHPDGRMAKIKVRDFPPSESPTPPGATT